MSTRVLRSARKQLLPRRDRSSWFVLSLLAVALFIVLVDVSFYAFVVLAVITIVVGVGYLMIRGPAKP
jgi:hypothetical protein